jgi:lipoyl(octanoyl) transferase
MPSVEAIDDFNSEQDFAIQDFGLVDYASIWKIQTQLVEERFNNVIPNTVLIGEHPPIITLGRQSKAENYSAAESPIISVERGGDATYHGPGQIVVYPILHLSPQQRDLHQLLRNFEEAIIRCLGDFNLKGIRLSGKTGVWVKQLGKLSEQTENDIHLFKIASIGVAVKRWVTYHGLSLNVSPTMSHFSQINPCGFPSSYMTSMHLLLDKPPSVADVKLSLIKHLKDVL